MAKHLAKSEKPKKKAVIDLKEREIKIPEGKRKKRANAHAPKQEDTFQTAMLNKTLDRKFSLSELALAFLALLLLVVLLGRVAPELLDPLLYSKEELNILRY